MVLIGVAAAVVVSGCSQIPGMEGVFQNEENNDDLESNPVAGKGLELTNLEVVDSSLRPGQSTQLTLTFRNYHISETTIESLEIYNTGPLQVEESFPSSCSPETIGASQNGLHPRMDCEIEVSVPEDYDLNGFDSKRLNPGVQVTYSTSITNSGHQYEANFLPANEIETAGEETSSFSNGEVSVTISADQPFPSENGGTMRFEIAPTERGQVLQDLEGALYRVNIESGDAIFEEGNCGTEFLVGSGKKFEPVIGNEASFGCQVSAESNEALTYPVVFSIAYKYRISSSLNIEVISNAT